jgi:toxin ParE1/3/4
MSAPEIRLKLSRKARADFTGILQYTGETWGQKQLLVYRDLLAAALETLRGAPNLGRRHADLPPIHRVYLVGSHVIVYRLKGSVLWVARILHQRMSLARHV